MPDRSKSRPVGPDTFDANAHYYPRVPNARLHPLVRHFLTLGNTRIIQRYCHLHPEATPDAVATVLRTPPRYFRWAGADLFHTATEQGVRRNVVVEINSSPSGQKSMPLIDEDEERGGYRTLLERTLLPMLARRKLPTGGLAVLWDKNEMEVTGYAATLADLTGEPVHLVYWPPDDPDPQARFTPDTVLEIRTADGVWIPIRAAFRYVTQRPWTRIPPLTRTAMLNPVITCLAGGRNKLLAAKAYDIYNSQMRTSGLAVCTPETIWDVGRDAVPLWVARMGGVAVVKNPYSNAGQGVYTITNPHELEEFMDSPQRYERFIVQALIGNSGWTSKSATGRYFHVGTVPDRKGRIFVADLRFMVGATPDGFYPLSLYARRARSPLTRTLDPTVSSWEMLGTNLSVRDANGWRTEPDRLMLVDSRDFNQLGVGLDDLVEAYIQTALGVTAIDQMAQHLTTRKGVFRYRAFASLNPDPALADEVIR